MWERIRKAHIRKHEYAMSGLLVLSCQLRKLIEKLAALRRRFTTLAGHAV